MFNLLRIKITTIIIFCLFVILIPLANFVDLGKLSDKKIKFGADLKGGKQVLLQVDSNFYIKERLLDIVDDLKIEFKKNRIKAIPKIRKDLQEQKESDFYIQFIIRRESDLGKVKEVLSTLKKDLVYKVSDSTVNVKLKKSVIKNIENMLVDKTIKTLRKRVFMVGQNNFIFHKKDKDKILVQTFDNKNITELKESVSKTGLLTFNFVVMGNGSMTGVKKVKAINSNYRYSVEKKAGLTGELLVDAQMTYYRGNPSIVFKFNAEGTQKFAKITKENIGKSLAIILDNEVIMAPKINSSITNGSGIISGSFTEEEAVKIAKILKAGALPAPVKILEEQSVKSTLNKKFVNNVVKVCLTLIIVFVLFFFVMYKKFGLFINISLFLNICLIITVLSLCNIAISYFGIVAFILSILVYLILTTVVFEKIKKTKQKGKSILASIEKGFEVNSKLAISFIILIVLSCLLYLFGNYSVQNFSLVFIIGLLSSMFTVLLFTKSLIMLGLNKFHLKKVKF